MKVAIDVQTTLGQKTGFGFYVENLIKNIQKIDQKNKYFFIKPDSDKDLSTLKRLIWDQIKFPRFAEKKQVDIIHQPCFSSLIFHQNVKTVVTVHDIINVRFANELPFFSRQYFKRFMPFSYHGADQIICDSIYTKNDLVKYLKISEKKITVVHLAANEIFYQKVSLAQIKRIKEKYNTGDHYFLHTGTINPRKNLQFLVRVFAQISKKYPKYKFVVIGKKGWYFKKLSGIAKELGVRDKIIFTGYVNDDELSALYQGTEIFLYPSLYEGFGLPPLEAMASGIPTISSNYTSLPEVVGDGGMLLSPINESAWIKAIDKIINDRKFHDELSQRGTEQAKKFSWKKCARETIAVYEKAYYSKS